MKLKVKKKFVSFFVANFAWLGKLWYQTTLFFTRIKHFPIEPANDINRIPERLKFGTGYKPDPKIDIMYHPSRVQKWVETNRITHMDCDDHASYWISVILKSDLAKEVYLGTFQFILDGKIQGHALVIFKDVENHWWCADYKYPIKLDDKWDFAWKSAESFNSTPIVATTFRVNKITKNDTPILGKVQAKVFN